MKYSFLNQFVSLFFITSLSIFSYQMKSGSDYSISINQINLNLDTFLLLDNREPFNNPFRIHLTDSTLITCDASSEQEIFFSMYDLERKKKIGEFIKRGSLDGQAISVLSNGYNEKNNYVWLHDVKANKLIKQSIANKESSTEAPIVSVNLPNFYYALYPMSNNKILCAGLESSTDGKFFILNSTSGKVESKYGLYDDKPEGISLESWIEAKRGFLSVQKNEKNAALAYSFTDAIDFLDLQTGKTTTVRGPNKFNPEFNLLDSDFGNRVYRTEKSRNAYLDGCSTENYLYLLYSGELENNPNKWSGKIIFVYDWEGAIIRQINLDSYVTCIAVSQNNEWLYAFNPVTKYIVRTKLTR